MINQIRADFYRQAHTFGIVLLAAITAVYAALVCGFEAPGGIMVNGPMSMLDKLAAKDWTLYDGLHGGALSSSVLVYFFIALFVIVIGSEFSQRIYKNTLVSGISRLGFVLGKYVVMLIDILVGMIWYYVIVLLTGVIAGRTMGTSIGRLASFTATTLLVTTFFVSVVFSLALVLLIVTKSLVLSAVFIVVWPLGISLLSIAIKWHWLTYFDFFNVASGISFNMLSTADTWRCVWVSVAVLIGSILVASTIIKRQEL